MSDSTVVPPIAELPTHAVFNQSTPLEGVDLFQGDLALRERLQAADAGWLLERASQLGRVAGSHQMQEWGRLANENIPKFKPFDRFGQRIDEVEFHPAYHHLMEAAMRHELPSCAWNHDEAGHLGFVSLGYLFGQAEAGVLCPMTMTYAAAPTLMLEPALDPVWLEKLRVPEYDPRLLRAADKRSLTFGMAMTEKQGGSDVRANSTRATPVDGAGRGRAYLLTGHKWFCSAPMSDAFLTLAYTEAGLSCFLVPRVRPDGTRNNFFIQRLKDKVGNKSNASSEIEYNQTWCQLVGEEGAGVRTIIEMVRHTRLACVAGSAALMRQALTQAIHHTRRRSAFGAILYEQPLMRQVLADLAIESEASMQLMVKVANAFDSQEKSEHHRALSRIAVTIAKYWVCKRAPQTTYEAMECFGGPGYVEENPMGRVFRESPLNSIWEGSGNIMSLDILRAMQKEPDCVEALRAEFASHQGRHPILDATFKTLHRELSETHDLVPRARRVTELMALSLQACAMAESAPEFMFDAFLKTRLGPDRSHTFGALARGIPVDAILTRAFTE